MVTTAHQVLGVPVTAIVSRAIFLQVDLIQATLMTITRNLLSQKFPNLSLQFPRQLRHGPKPASALGVIILDPPMDTTARHVLKSSP